MQVTDTMNTRQAAERLGKDPRTVVRWVNAGKLQPLLKAPGYRGSYIFTVAEVERAAAELDGQQEEEAAS